MKIKAAIFDVGGVLHSSEGEHIERDICITLGITHEQYKRGSEALLEQLQLGRINEERFWEQLVSITNAPNQLPGESLLGREFDRRYKVFTKVLEIVAALKKQGIKVAILSNTIETHAQINQSHGIYDPFEIRILSHQVGLAKPDPETYKLTLKKLKSSPEQTIFIDDKKEHVEAAKNLGIRGIQFQDAESLLQGLRGLGITI